MTKKPKPVDLSEYEQEAVPFDAVIRQLARVKPAHPAPHKPQRKAKKRAK
jgi:hypothetical protein